MVRDIEVDFLFDLHWNDGWLGMNFDKASLEPCTEKQNWFQICITIYGGKNISCLFIGNNASLAPCSSERCKSPSNVNLQKRLWKLLLATAVNQSRADFFLPLSPSLQHLHFCPCWAACLLVLSPAGSTPISQQPVGVARGAVHKRECSFPFVLKGRAKWQCLGLRSWCR